MQACESASRPWIRPKLVSKFHKIKKNILDTDSIENAKKSSYILTMSGYRYGYLAKPPVSPIWGLYDHLTGLGSDKVWVHMWPPGAVVSSKYQEHTAIYFSTNPGCLAKLDTTELLIISTSNHCLLNIKILRVWAKLSNKSGKDSTSLDFIQPIQLALKPIKWGLPTSVTNGRASQSTPLSMKTWRSEKNREGCC